MTRLPAHRRLGHPRPTRAGPSHTLFFAVAPTDPGTPAPSLGWALEQMDRALEQLDDSHTFIIPPTWTSYWDFGFTAQYVGDTAFVTRGAPGGAADSAGLQAGDEILTLGSGFPHRRTMQRSWFRQTLLNPREVLASLAQDSGRGKVFGDRTAGAVMLADTRRYRVRQGEGRWEFGLSISVGEFRTAGGVLLEGRGVVPDEIVLPSRADLRDGANPALARALRELGLTITAAEAGRLYSEGGARELP